MRLDSITDRVEKKHWELHLQAAQKDLPSNKEVLSFLSGETALPSLSHPSYIHDWLEHPDRRADLEALRG